MNKHFEDARYYLKRAGETAKAGIKKELEPIQEKVNEIISEDEEPEPGRFDSVREDLKDLGERAEGETREAIENAREKINDYRSEQRPEQ